MGYIEDNILKRRKTEEDMANHRRSRNMNRKNKAPQVSNVDNPDIHELKPTLGRYYSCDVFPGIFTNLRFR